MRISDWSSDVCSSDLREIDTAQHVAGNGRQRDADLGLKAGAERLVAAERLDGKRGELAKIGEAGPFLAKRFVRPVTDLRPFQQVHRGLIIGRSDGHTSELQSLMRISYAVFCLEKTQ